MWWCSYHISRAQNIGRSTDSVRPNLRFVRSTFHLSGHLVRSDSNIRVNFHVHFLPYLVKQEAKWSISWVFENQFIDCVELIIVNFSYSAWRTAAIFTSRRTYYVWVTCCHNHMVNKMAAADQQLAEELYFYICYQMSYFPVYWGCFLSWNNCASHDIEPSYFMSKMCDYFDRTKS